MRKIALLLIWVFALVVPARAQELGPIKVYSGPEGERVAIVRYGKPADNQVLLQIKGIDHEWNDQVFLATRQEVGDNRVEISFQVDGKPYYVVVGREMWGRMTWALFLKGTNRSVELTFNDELTEKAKAQSVLDAYKRNPGKP